MIKRYINVKNQIEGMHRYEDAPFEVSFLRDLHRHQFHIYTRIEVFHDDRELEFILVQRRIKKALESVHYFKDGVLQLDKASCEMLGLAILDELQDWYGKHRDIKISVYEDDENGATVIYTKEEEQYERTANSLSLSAESM